MHDEPDVTLNHTSQRGVSWDDMEGGDKERRCSTCSKQVMACPPRLNTRPRCSRVATPRANTSAL